MAVEVKAENNPAPGKAALRWDPPRLEMKTGASRKAMESVNGGSDSNVSINPGAIVPAADLSIPVTAPAQAGFNPDVDRTLEEAIAAMKSAGAVIVGRTNLTEFAYSGLGINPHYGTPRNPWDRKTGRVPGGSSSGAAVAQADGMCVMALGVSTWQHSTLKLARSSRVKSPPSSRTPRTISCKMFFARRVMPV